MNLICKMERRITKDALVSSLPMVFGEADYNGLKIEVKESSYCHAWSDKANTTSPRNFGITKAYSRYKDTSSTYKRQNDVYVFCLNTCQNTRYSSPLDLISWRFFIFKTSVINEL